MMFAVGLTLAKLHLITRALGSTWLLECSLSHFPMVGERRNAGVKHTQTVDLHCSCHMPEERDDKMAECDVCKRGITNTVWTFPVMFLVI